MTGGPWRTRVRAAAEGWATDPHPIRRRAPPVLLMLFAAAAPAACGKKGPPVAPLRILPAAARDLQVRQVGEDAVISASVPGVRTDGTRIERPVVRILKMRARPGFNPAAVARGYLVRLFEKEADLLAALQGETLERAAPGGRLVFRDAGALLATPPAGTPGDAPPVAGDRRAARPSGPRLLYSVQIGDERGRRSDLPVPILLELLAPPPAPEGLRVETAEGELRFSWRPGPETPPKALYNVYRARAGEPPETQAPLNRQPIADPAWVDRTFRYGETYACFVRTVAGTGLPPRESGPSETVVVTPLDVYPPAAPVGLAVAVEGQAMRLYWFPNEEPDLGGYLVYRRAADAAEFVRLGAADPSEPSFVDATAASGVRYHYRVTAIDAAVPPNESAPSEEQSEMMPQRAPAPGSRR